MEKAVTALQDGIVNVVADKRGMVSVTVEFKGPALSAAIANTYIMILSEYLNEHAINANFQVLDPAVTPEKKYKPSIRFNVMMSGVASLLAGILFVFTLEYIRKVREKEQKIEPDLALRL
jgi:capsular polysaccharide biosynthesis protein